MKSLNIDRLQGTDGIRRQVRPAKEFRADPLTVYLEHDFLTEEFFELYCYAHVSDLIERGKMQPGDEVLIGWDSRDTENLYTSRAVEGIAKAGGLPAVLGAMPTPGVAIALVKRSAASAFMITASHNPRDQNGIKIFLAPNGMKMLPEDDRRLTAKVCDTDYGTVKEAKQKYAQFSLEEEGRRMFADFHLDPQNSLITGGRKLFSKIVLVVDPAHGAMASCAAGIFRELGFGEVIEVAGEQNGRVNENSGVAFLEGVKKINRERLESEPGFARHELVKRMFDEGRKRAEELRQGKIRLIGVAFDADGDRFFLLVYDPSDGAISILSGDETAAIQAEYLVKTWPDRYIGSMFVHTVESDINMARHGATLGFVPVVTAVGDKWILQKALGGKGDFGLGCEETGHSIHGGMVKGFGGDEKAVYAGNGLKGAINTLTAVECLGSGKPMERFYEWIIEPFEPGFKSGGYAYYVDKSLFNRGTKVWRALEEKVCEAFKPSEVKGISIREEEIEGEPEMLYFRFEREGEGLIGTLFIRNSGTEDKIGVNARGPVDMKETLDEIVNGAVGFLMKEMKDSSKPMASAEAKVLKQIHNSEPVKPEFYKDVDFERLLFEMEIKQKLIKRKDGGFALTVLGRELVD